MVEGDAHRLEQVLLNLLTNAINYAPGTERIGVRLLTEGDVALIEVEDAGPGIAEEDLPRVFTRFFQTGRAGRPAPGLVSGCALPRRSSPRTVARLRRGRQQARERPSPSGCRH